MIAALHKGVQNAVERHFTWSRGSTITDFGAENIISVCTAEAIYNRYADNEKVYVNLEMRLSDKRFGLDPNKISVSGRVDVYAEISDEVFFVEAKRFLGLSAISKDLFRLTQIRNFSKLNNRNVRCFLVAPIFRCRGEYSDYMDHFSNVVIKDYVHKTGFCFKIDTEKYNLSERLAHAHYDRFESVVIEVQHGN